MSFKFTPEYQHEINKKDLQKLFGGAFQWKRHGIMKEWIMLDFVGP